jgi:hypothetical protein
MAAITLLISSEGKIEMTNIACEQSVLEEQTTDELIHLIRKFRWMGLNEEAMKAQAQLARHLDWRVTNRFRYKNPK